LPSYVQLVRWVFHPFVSATTQLDDDIVQVIWYTCNQSSPSSLFCFTKSSLGQTR